MRHHFKINLYKKKYKQIVIVINKNNNNIENKNLIELKRKE